MTKNFVKQLDTLLEQLHNRKQGKKKIQKTITIKQNLRLLSKKVFHLKQLYFEEVGKNKKLEKQLIFEKEISTQNQIKAKLETQKQKLLENLLSSELKCKEVIQQRYLDWELKINEQFQQLQILLQQQQEIKEQSNVDKFMKEAVSLFNNNIQSYLSRTFDSYQQQNQIYIQEINNSLHNINNSESQSLQDILRFKQQEIQELKEEIELQNSIIDGSLRQKNQIKQLNNELSQFAKNQDLLVEYLFENHTNLKSAYFINKGQLRFLIEKYNQEKATLHQEINQSGFTLNQNFVRLTKEKNQLINNKNQLKEILKMLIYENKKLRNTILYFQPKIKKCDLIYKPEMIINLNVNDKNLYDNISEHVENCLKLNENTFMVEEGIQVDYFDHNQNKEKIVQQNQFSEPTSPVQSENKYLELKLQIYDLEKQLQVKQLIISENQIQIDFLQKYKESQNLKKDYVKESDINIDYSQIENWVKECQSVYELGLQQIKDLFTSNNNTQIHNNSNFDFFKQEIQQLESLSQKEFQHKPIDFELLTKIYLQKETPITQVLNLIQKQKQIIEENISLKKQINVQNDSLAQFERNYTLEQQIQSLMNQLQDKQTQINELTQNNHIDKFEQNHNLSTQNLLQEKLFYQNQLLKEKMLKAELEVKLGEYENEITILQQQYNKLTINNFELIDQLKKTESIQSIVSSQQENYTSYLRKQLLSLLILIKKLKKNQKPYQVENIKKCNVEIMEKLMEKISQRLKKCMEQMSVILSKAKFYDKKINQEIKNFQSVLKIIDQNVSNQTKLILSQNQESTQDSIIKENSQLINEINMLQNKCLNLQDKNEELEKINRDIKNALNEEKEFIKQNHQEQIVIQNKQIQLKEEYDHMIQSLEIQLNQEREKIVSLEWQQSLILTGIQEISNSEIIDIEKLKRICTKLQSNINKQFIIILIGFYQIFPYIQ